MSSPERLDLFVIGGGSAGVRLARTAGALGARVAMAEQDRLGGTCVNVGCVPKKLLVHGAHVAHDLADAAGFGWHIEGARFDWATLRKGQEAEVARLNGVYRRIVSQAGVDILDGRATLEGPHAVRVDGRLVHAEHIAIATGAVPHRPSFPGAELALVSDDCFVLPRLPASLLVVGSGYIALEFAGIFAALGVETTLAVRGFRVLPRFDPEVSAFVRSEIEKKHVRVKTGREVVRLEPRSDALCATFDDGSEHRAEQVLLAVGRTPNVAGLGLESMPLPRSAAGAILRDAEFRTGVPSIRALGDVTGGMQLTPVALAEGTALAHTLFGGRGPVAVDHETVPTAVFSMPEVASVGLSEPEAAARGGALRIYTTDFRPLRHTVSGSPERMFMKLVVDDASDRVLGAHVVGGGAAEIVQGVAIALRCRATKAQFDATLGIHPTGAEELVTMRTPTRRVEAKAP